MKLAIWSALVLIARTTIAVDSKGVTVECASTRECTVQFPLDDGKTHSVRLVKEHSSVFAKDASFGFVDGVQTAVATRATFGDRFHTEHATDAKMWATALIHVDRRQLVSGIFSTKDHGIIEWDREDSDSPLNRRRTEDIGTDIVLNNPDGHPWQDTAARVAVSSESDISVASRNQILPFFPNCFMGDTTTHVFKMNLVYDYGLYSQLAGQVTGDENAKRDKILSDLETIFSYGKLIFLLQLNVKLEIQQVVFGKASDSVPLSRGGNTCTTATGAMDEMMTWVNVQNQAAPTGYWMLMSNCFSGVNGVSYIGSICGSRNNGGVAAYSWVVVFHELGHGFGMSHSFENGVGTTGGLMDYGDPSYNGVVQFHPNKAREVCPFLDFIQRSSTKCPFFYRASSDSVCGDGIMDSSEECECMVAGTTKCNECVNCRLTDKSIQCSASSYLVRQPSTPSTVVVEPSALSSAQCCLRGKTAGPKTLCGDGLLNVCGAAGKCQPVCTQFLFTDNPNCGFDNSGCQLGCMWKNKCRFDMTYTDTVDSLTKLISAVPDGTTCNLSTSKRGMCSAGVCMDATGAISTYAPTLQTTTGLPTDVDMTEQPTPAPSKVTPTKKPTKTQTPAPTKKAPTSRPTKRVPTNSPTEAPIDLKPSNSSDIRCMKFRAQTRCKRQNCSWCAVAKVCMSNRSCVALRAASRG